MIYVLEHQNPAEGNGLAHLLPQDRQEYISSIRNEKSRGLSLLASLLLCYGIFEEYGIPAADLRFVYSPKGKPFLQSHPRIHFSLSHSNIGAAVCIDTSPCGIDIEAYRPVTQSLVQRVCTPDEQTTVWENNDPKRHFTALWALKESYVKAVGGVLSDGLQKISFIIEENQVKTSCPFPFFLFPCDAYAVASCSSAHKIKKISLCELQKL